MAKVSSRYDAPRMLPGSPLQAAKTPADAGSVIAAIEASWHISSWELQTGMDMSEQPLDSLPGELIDALFPTGG